MTRGQRIQQRRDKLGMSQLKLALACGWKSKSRISMYERDEREPSNRDVIKIAQALGVTPNWLDYGDSQPEELTILVCSPPVLSYSDAVNWHDCAEALRDIIRKDKEKIPMRSKGYEKCYALHVTNDLLKPEVKTGEFVIVDADKKPEAGSLVVAYKKGSEEAMLKKYTVDGPTRYLESNREDIKPIEVDENIKIIGVVVYIQPPGREPPI